jgi:hypothetical protein
MAEELEDHNDGTFSGLKKTVIGIITTAVMGLGTWGITQITGGSDEPAPAPVQQAAPIINITNSNQQSQSAGGGTTKIIERERVVEKPAVAPKPKKKEGDEFKETPPAW